MVIVFDAGLPVLPECTSGCEANERHLCIHRFPPNVRIVAHTKRLQTPNLPDLQVLKYILSLAGKEHGGSLLGHTPFLLMTTDKRFWKSARHQYLSKNGRERMHILFDDRMLNIVHAVVRGHVVRVDIVSAPGKSDRKSGPAMLRWAAIQGHRYLRGLSRKRPH
jgi:hypothetical protein